MAVKSMLAWKSFMHSGLVLLGMLLCWGLSSCSPWERDLNKVYQATQKGNKNAMLVSKEKACTLCSHYGHISEYCPLVGEKRTI